MKNNTRDRLIDLLEQAEGQVNNDTPTLEMIADYLIAKGVVPVVRCKNCKFYEESRILSPTEKASKNICRLIKRQIQPTDYCSYGERKE